MHGAQSVVRVTMTPAGHGWAYMLPLAAVGEGIHWAESRDFCAFDDALFKNFYIFFFKMVKDISQNSLIRKMSSEVRRC